MKGLIIAIQKHDKAIILILLAIFIFGLINYNALPKEETPDIQIPILYIPLYLEGISPEDSEKLLVMPLERRLKSISGIDEIKSYAYENGGYVLMEFSSDTNIKTVINEVRAKVDEARPEMPSNLRNVTVHEVNLSLYPVLNIILTGQLNDSQFKAIAKTLKDRIEAVPEVLKVSVNGDREDVIEIKIPRRNFELYNINIDELSRNIAQNSFLIQAGAIKNESGEFSIKASGMFASIEDIRKFPVKSEGGQILKMEDIATITATYKDRESIARVNGQPAVVLEVSKRTGSNIIEVIDKAKAIVEAEKAFLPPHLRIIYSQDNSTKIKDMLKELLNSILLAVLIVFAVIVFELGLVSGLLVAVAIPGSFFIGISIISYMNLTINIVVLFSLILSIGMLVDAAIVITEYADRQMIGGMSRIEAYKKSAINMFWPSVAASVTTKIVFLPLLFWPGITGKFMRYLPLTLIATLLGSLFMALVFIPVLGGYFGKPKKMTALEIERVNAIEEGDFAHLHGMARHYYKLLDRALKMPRRTISLIMSILISIIVLFKIFGAGVEFFPSIEPNNANIDIRARGNLSIQEKDTLMKEVEAMVLGMKSEVKVFYTKLGLIDRTLVNSDIVGRIYLEFQDWEKRRKVDVILDEIRNKLTKIPGIKIQIETEKKGPGAGKDVEIELSARDPAALEGAVEKVLGYFGKIKKFQDIEDGQPLPLIEYDVKIDREKASLNGVNVAALNSLLPLVTNGVIVSKFRSVKFDEEVDIIVRFEDNERNLDSFRNLRVAGKFGMIPITNFVEIIPTQKNASIERNNSIRIKMIKANVQPGLVVDNLIREIKKTKQGDATWDNSVVMNFKGSQKDMKQTQDFLGKAFAYTLIGMMITLVIQFNNIFMSLIIMTAVFFSIVGVLVGLLITHQPFGIVMCGIAVITLAGIVVNNNILLIDAYFKLLEDGVPRFKAIEQAAVSRLRPIVLTSLTTAIGLFPMIIGMDLDFFNLSVSFGAPGTQWWTQLATSIASGVIFATILTLFFTPAVLVIHANRLEKKARLGKPRSL